MIFPFVVPMRRRASTLVSVFICLLFLAPACSGKKDVRPEGPFDAEKSLAKANELIDKKEYEDARKLLLEVKNRDLTKKFSPLAQLRIADTYVKEEDYDLAVEEYRRFLEIYPDHKNASYAQYQIGMTYFTQIDSPERGYGAAARALAEFEKMKQLFPRNPYKELVDLRIQQCRNIMAEYEFLVGEYYFKKGSYAAALKRYEGLLAKFPDYKKEPVVLMRMALSQKGLGNRDKAVDLLNTLLRKFPNDGLVKDANRELAALGK